MKIAALFILFAGANSAFAMKSHVESFSENCEVVWKASVSVAKTQDYRIISVSKEEQIISLAAGGAWWGERVISLSLEPGKEGGCNASVQSRYSGLQHSDGPDLLARIHIELAANKFGRDSEAFKKLKACLDGYDNSEAKCEAKFRKRMAAEAAKQPTANAEPTWNVAKP